MSNIMRFELSYRIYICLTVLLWGVYKKNVFENVSLKKHFIKMFFENLREKFFQKSYRFFKRGSHTEYILFDSLYYGVYKRVFSNYLFEVWVFINVFREPSRKVFSEKFSGGFFKR